MQGGNGRIPARAPSPLPGRHEKHTQTKRQAREAARQAALEEEAERQQERQKWEEPLRTAKERWQQQRQEREELLRAAEERRQQQRQKWEEWQRADKARRQQQVLPLARPLAAAASGTAALQPPSTRPLPSLRVGVMSCSRVACRCPALLGRTLGPVHLFDFDWILLNMLLVCPAACPDSKPCHPITGARPGPCWRPCTTRPNDACSA